MGATVIWFRRDLRLADHAVVERACQLGAVLPLFVLAVARVAFLLDSLRALMASYAARVGACWCAAAILPKCCCSWCRPVVQTG